MPDLTCKRCNTPLKGDDVNIEAAIGKCHLCNAVFGLGDTTTRPRVLMPDKFSVDEESDGLVIRRSWKSAEAFFLLLFAIFWNGFLVVWFGKAFSTGAWSMAALGLLHAIGIGIAYSVVCCFLNTTVIRVRTGRLVIRHGPLPWPGNHDLSTSDLDQLYVTEHVSRQEDSTFYRYDVVAALRSGRTLVLLTELEEMDGALFVEQQIESRLGIKDRPVAGEVPR